MTLFSRISRILRQVLWRNMAALLAGALFFTVHAVAASPGQSPPRVMVFGDSLAAAYNIDPRQGWVALLGDKLKTIDPKGQVINASISGETTQGGLARIKADLTQHKPTHVILELGANDALRGLPLAATRANLEAMIRAIQAAKATPIVVGLQIPPNYGPDYAAKFQELFPSLARQFKAPLVPFLLEGIAEERDQFLPDGLHPTAAAQPKVMNNVWPTLQSALKKR
jgi:acyl-CoA thioesterase I